MQYVQPPMGFLPLTFLRAQKSETEQTWTEKLLTYFIRKGKHKKCMVRN